MNPMTNSVNIYLTFNGNCEEAFNFYKSVFGGEFAYFSRFKDLPDTEAMKLSAIDQEKVLHLTLPISKETSLMGCDTGSLLPTASFGNNFWISVNAKSKPEANRLFNALSEHGNIVMPMGNTYWGAYFGMFTDKFGINWMLNYRLDQH
jgi:PhnB protein